LRLNLSFAELSPFSSKGYLSQSKPVLNHFPKSNPSEFCWSRFGTRGSEVQILSPRPFHYLSFLFAARRCGLPSPAGVCCRFAIPAKDAPDPRKREPAGKAMARFARAIATGVAHHATQRGNARRSILNSDADRNVYLGLLRENLAQHHASLIGYCLMSNHIHLVIVPHQPDALAATLKHAHGRYAAYWNAKHGSSGHVWQGRYYSCPLDGPQLWEALRYTELNPVRARLAAEAESWRWSSAAVHCRAMAADGWLDMEAWEARWDAATWRDYLRAGQTELDIMAVRHCTHTGRPLGSDEFVRELEERTKRALAPQKGGRPGATEKNKGQEEFAFEP
jgi:putative transposase